MQWQRAFVTVLVAGLIFTGCDVFPIVDLPVTNLTIGLVTSMITAIFFTRGVINWVYGRRTALKQLSIGIKV